MEDHPLRSATGAVLMLTVLISVPVILTNNVIEAAIIGGFIPARLSGLVTAENGLPTLLTPFSATFLHAGFFHLLMNMLILFWCGRAIEAALGARNFLLIYGVGAFFAAMAEYWINPQNIAPIIGASGAISAIIGAYSLAFGRQKPIVRHPGINRAINVAWLLAAWIVIQWMIGYLGNSAGYSIAIVAHIGGFIAGLVLFPVLLRWHYREA